MEIDVSVESGKAGIIRSLSKSSTRLRVSCQQPVDFDKDLILLDRVRLGGILQQGHSTNWLLFEFFPYILSRGHHKVAGREKRLIRLG